MIVDWCRHAAAGRDDGRHSEALWEERCGGRSTVGRGTDRGVTVHRRQSLLQSPSVERYRCWHGRGLYMYRCAWELCVCVSQYVWERPSDMIASCKISICSRLTNTGSHKPCSCWATRAWSLTCALCNPSFRLYPFTSPPSTLSFSIFYVFLFRFLTCFVYFLVFPSLPILPE